MYNVQRQLGFQCLSGFGVLLPPLHHQDGDSVACRMGMRSGERTLSRGSGGSDDGVVLTLYMVHTP